MGSAKVLTVVAASLALSVPAANAQSPSLEGYVGPGGGVLDETAKGGTPPAVVPTEVGGVMDETAAGGPGDATAVAPVAASEGAAEQPVATQQASEGGQLPFTGFDVAIMAAVGALLLALGVGIRLMSRPARSAGSV